MIVVIVNLINLFDIAKYDSGDASAHVTDGFKNFNNGILGPFVLYNSTKDAVINAANAINKFNKKNELNFILTPLQS